MPLQQGKSNKTMSANISELMKSFKDGGTFAQGKTPKKARQMAVAAAFNIKRSAKK